MTTLELFVTRKWFTKRSTTGEWRTAAGDLLGYSLEPGVRAGTDNVLQPAEKVPGQTAVPTGRRRVVLDWSPKFKQVMPHLLDVPLFESIRIHIVNKPEDTEGCLGIGMTRGPDFIGASLIAYGRLCEVICAAITRGEQVFVTIVGDPPETFWNAAA
jgi:hypothetical protein